MSRLPWLADVLRAAGQTVVEVPGWETRGSALFDPVGILWHHTATPPTWTRENLIRLLRDGRRDLPGPLAQLGLERDGTWLLIAAGRANHAGTGAWRGVSGNTRFIGIEAANRGDGEPWPKAQMAAYLDGTAALCRHTGIPADMVAGHKEYAPTRKIDPAGLHMPAMRDGIAHRLIEEDRMTPEQERILTQTRDAMGRVERLLLEHDAALKAAGLIAAGGTAPRNLATDSRVSRLALRAIAAKLGLSTGKVVEDDPLKV